MNEQEMDLNYLFNEMPIYSKRQFNILYKKDEKYYIDKDELKRCASFISNDSRKIVTNCIWCNRNFSFDYRYRIYTANTSSYFSERSNIILVWGGQSNCELNIVNKDYFGTEPPYEEESLYTENFYIIYSITCNNNSSHCYYMSILARVEKGIITITKIGQYPTMLSIKGFDFDKYKKQLKRYDAYEDYKNADLSMANNFHAGAYTYLRRVYEKQLNYYVEKDKPVLTDNRTETKIKAVKNNFDPRIHEHLNNLYSILSIGIHELDEEESQNYYEYLKAMIDMQLQYEKSKDEEDKQTKSLSTKISNIVNSLNKRKAKNDS